MLVCAISKYYRLITDQTKFLNFLYSFFTKKVQSLLNISEMFNLAFYIQTFSKKLLFLTNCFICRNNTKRWSLYNPYILKQNLWGLSQGESDKPSKYRSNNHEGKPADLKKRYNKIETNSDVPYHMVLFRCKLSALKRVSIYRRAQNQGNCRWANTIKL